MRNTVFTYLSLGIFLPVTASKRVLCLKRSGQSTKTGRPICSIRSGSCNWTDLSICELTPKRAPNACPSVDAQKSRELQLITSSNFTKNTKDGFTIKSSSKLKRQLLLKLKETRSVACNPLPNGCKFFKSCFFKIFVFRN